MNIILTFLICGVVNVTLMLGLMGLFHEPIRPRVPLLLMLLVLGPVGSLVLLISAVASAAMVAKWHRDLHKDQEDS